MLNQAYFDLMAISKQCSNIVQQHVLCMHSMASAEINIITPRKCNIQYARTEPEGRRPENEIHVHVYRITNLKRFRDVNVGITERGRMI